VGVAPARRGLSDRANGGRPARLPGTRRSERLAGMVGAWAEGPREDFAAAVGAELPGLYRYARSITVSDAEAEDLVGDTVLRALERAAQYRGEASVRTWLHRILSRLAIDRARHRAHELSVEDVEARWRDDAYSVDAAAVVERAESAAELRDALVHIPCRYRAAVVLHDAEAFTAGEVASVLGISLPAAKQRIRRGRMMLVSALSQGERRRAANAGVPLSCWEARERVSGYIDGELEPAGRAALEAHLAGCATCPPLYQAIVGATSALGHLRDPDSVIPAALAERVRRHLGLAPLDPAVSAAERPAPGGTSASEAGPARSPAGRGTRRGELPHPP